MHYENSLSEKGTARIIRGREWPHTEREAWLGRQKFRTVRVRTFACRGPSMEKGLKGGKNGIFAEYEAKSSLFGPAKGSGKSLIANAMKTPSAGTKSLQMVPQNIGGHLRTTAKRFWLRLGYITMSSVECFFNDEFASTAIKKARRQARPRSCNMGEVETIGIIKDDYFKSEIVRRVLRWVISFLTSPESLSGDRSFKTSPTSSKVKWDSHSSLRTHPIRTCNFKTSRTEPVVVPCTRSPK